MSVRLLIGDCVERMRDLPDASVDSVVCDPPYHLTSIHKRFAKCGGASRQSPKKSHQYQRLSRGFMGQSWDGGDVAFRPETWAEVLRVLKPGGFLIAFGGDRTFHRLAVAVEDAGFDYRGTLAWVFGSGFPKSRDVSKDLADLPACSCDVSGNSRSVINSVPPTSLLGATVGTEPVSVLPTGHPTDGAEGLGLQPSAEAIGRQATVEGGIECAGGHLDPIVLGSLDMAGVAEGDEIARDVRVGKVKPEALRDKVVDDEPVSGSAVSTSSVTGNDLGAEGLPSDSLVAPLFAAPGGIGIADHPVPVVSGHASAGAVGSGPSSFEIVGAEVAETGLTGEDRHSENHTINGGNLQCSECGGIVAENIQDGLGTALKPALELIAMARKPLSEKNIAANVLKWGTGALNIDACRIEGEPWQPHVATGLASEKFFTKGEAKEIEKRPHDLGRWPANLCHDGSDEVVAGFPESESGSMRAGTIRTVENRVYGKGCSAAGKAATEREIEGSSGSAARFFYCAKATTEERGEGNNHPTVKPVALMRWLVRLVTPKGGTVLDPFMGSGSTGLACDAEQFNFIGCELSPDYAEIARRRIADQAGMFADISVEMTGPSTRAA